METPTHVDLFAVQPRVSLDDYASLEAFTARHRALPMHVEALRARDERGRGFFDNTFEAPSLILERMGPGEVRVLAQATDPRAEDVLQVTVPVSAWGTGGTLQEEVRTAVVG